MSMLMSLKIISKKKSMSRPVNENQTPPALSDHQRNTTFICWTNEKVKMWAISTGEVRKSRKKNKLMDFILVSCCPMCFRPDGVADLFALIGESTSDAAATSTERKNPFVHRKGIFFRR